MEVSGSSGAQSRKVEAPRQQAQGACRALLGGSWDIVTISNWGYNPAYNWDNPIRPFRGVISRVISPVLSSYYFP